VRRALVVIVIAASAVLGWTALRVWGAWQAVSRVAFDPATAREALGAGGSPTSVPATTTTTDAATPGTTLATTTTTTIPTPVHGIDDDIRVFLIIGSDERSPDDASRRADAIMLLLLPDDGVSPVLVSIPRDLYLHNPCTGGMSRINANLNGCEDRATGPELLAIAIEDFTGLAVDHFALFTFTGFRNVVNRVGGVEICTPVAVRDANVQPVPLDLPAGCSIANGNQTLAWVRSRHTEGFIDGNWVSIGANDLDRNQRQQEVLLQAMGRLSGMRDISELTALAEELADEFTIDDGLALSEAIDIAWGLRSIDVGSIARPVIPVEDFVTEGGASVLTPRATFSSVVIAANPAMARYFT
jgi:LCP family protein required for cell wall assembly